MAVANLISGLLNWFYFKNELLELTDFFHAGTISHKLKADQNLCVWTFVKNGCGQSGHGTLKLTVSQKWKDGIKWFFSYWYKFREAKSWFNDFWVGMVKNGHGF